MLWSLTGWGSVFGWVNTSFILAVSYKQDLLSLAMTSNARAV
jgi:hypothetical protein